MCTHHNDASVFCADGKYQRITIYCVERELVTGLSVITKLLCPMVNVTG